MFIPHTHVLPPSLPPDLYAFHPAEGGNILYKCYHYVTSDPWIGFILVMCLVHMTWVYILLLVQLFQVGVVKFVWWVWSSLLSLPFTSMNGDL